MTAFLGYIVDCNGSRLHIHKTFQMNLVLFNLHSYPRVHGNMFKAFQKSSNSFITFFPILDDVEYAQTGSEIYLLFTAVVILLLCKGFPSDSAFEHTLCLGLSDKRRGI